jgi:glutathione S-transferase
MPPTVTLYGLPRSVYTRIARLTLEEKAVPYRLEEVEIFGPNGVPAAYTKLHPFGRIPALAHGDLSIYETAAICRYIDEAFPGPSLQPPTPSGRARMAQIIGMLDSYAYRPMVWGVFVQRVRVPMAGGTTDEPLVSASLKETRTALEALAALAKNSPFLAGTALSLADLHAYPMLRYLSLAPEGLEAIGEHPPVVEWMARLTTRESVHRTVTQYEQHGLGRGTPRRSGYLKR